MNEEEMATKITKYICTAVAAVIITMIIGITTWSTVTNVVWEQNGHSTYSQALETYGHVK